MPDDAHLAVIERFRLIFFMTRHVIGLLLFVWLSVTAFQHDSPALGYLMLVITPLYAAFAFVSGRSLLRSYRQRKRRVAAGRGH